MARIPAMFVDHTNTINMHLGGSINEDDREDIESIHSEASDVSEDLDEVIVPQNNAADPYGNNLRFRRIRRHEVAHLG